MARVFNAPGWIGGAASMVRGLEDLNLDFTNTPTSANPVSGGVPGGWTISYVTAAFCSVNADFFGAQTVADYYARVFVNATSAIPTSNGMPIMRACNASGADLCRIVVNTDGKYHLIDASGTDFATVAIGLTASAKQCVELHFRAGTTTSNGTIEARIGGVSIGTTTVANTGTVGHAQVQCGNMNAGNYGVTSITFSDLAINDTSGSACNSWVGISRSVVLTCNGDNAVVGVLNGGGGSSPIWPALATFPPTAVALGSATATSQTKDATSNTTDNVKATTITPVAAGAGTSDTWVLAYAQALMASSTTTNALTGIQTTSNPVIAEVTANSGGTSGGVAAATFPTGWAVVSTAKSYTPTIAASSPCILELRKGTATTDSVMWANAVVIAERTPVTAMSGVSVVKKAHGGAWV